VLQYIYKVCRSFASNRRLGNRLGNGLSTGPGTSTGADGQRLEYDALLDGRALWLALSDCDDSATAATGGGAADYEARKNGRLALVACKRWKVAQTGVGPLRELFEAKKSAEAEDCIYVSAGEFNPNAREFAEKNAVRLLCDVELAKLVARVVRSGHRWKLF
jgi:hypothetical protein